MHNTPPYFINGMHRITINIIGAGGTGSLIVTKLARLNKALNELEHPGFYVNLIDYDIIENNNIGRQMFTENNIGEFKADVVISNINRAFNLDWDTKLRPFVPETDCYSNIVISCVDNVSTRENILDSFYDDKKGYNNDVSTKYYLIDCGNARDFGQVILSDYNKELKNINDIAPNWKKQDTEEEQGAGCSYLDSLSKQDLFVNDWVSLFAVNMIKELIFDKRINYQGVFFNSKECLTQKMKL